MGLLLAVVGSACFEDTNPVDETGAIQSSGEECILGTEGCPCIEGSCIEGLACLSSVCVDPGSTSDGTTTDGPSTSTTATATTTPTTLDEGPLDEGPMTTSMGGLPQGSPCDPFFDQCEPGLACVGVDETGFYCDLPGVGQQDEACEGLGYCAPGLLCVQATELARCASMACCTTLCDVFSGGMCPGMLLCQPFYPPMTAPPGYEHVGICATPG